MNRVNVDDYIKKNGASFYAKMFEEEKKELAKAISIKAELEKKME
ncbi:hypothetical protein [Paenibacillus ihuae]|nr:hypothetical protein [Paenibacillus ihuae]